jgi:hypothetical protein
MLLWLAWSTWCFANIWVELGKSEGAYFARYAPVHFLAAPAIVLELFLAAALFGIGKWSHRRGLEKSPWANRIFVAACAVPFVIGGDAILQSVPSGAALVGAWFRAAEWPCFLAAVGCFLFLPLATSRWLERLFLYSWPVLLVMYANAAFRGLSSFPSAAYADGPLRPVNTISLPRIRVIWIIFDEMSQAVAFTHRPADLQLTELDRLRSLSFYATNATAPGRETLLSMPGLTTGKVVTAAIPRGPANLELRTSDSPEPVSWSALRNVFDDAASMGLNIGLVGWYHAYGRVLNRSLTECYWTSIGYPPPPEPRTLADAVWREAASQAATFFWLLPSGDGGRIERDLQVRRFYYSLERSRELAANPFIGLSLLHIPVPHPPSIYDRSRGTVSATRGHGYVDNLALADRALGELRRSIERAGLWDRTAVLLSADHGWRTQAWRAERQFGPGDEAASHGDTMGVPFLLHLPGERESLEYSNAFNTVITRLIIGEILTGKLRKASDVADLLRSVDAAKSH